MYRTFTRTWWKDNNNGMWPNNLEPHMGKKHFVSNHKTEIEALKECRKYNKTNNPGKYSRKMEYSKG